jgi:hypothetical protein
MPRPQAEAYEQVIQRAMAARGTGKRGHMLEILHMLRGVSLHPYAPEDATGSYFEESARLQSTFETLNAIKAKGEKALIFCESLAMQRCSPPKSGAATAWGMTCCASMAA